MYEVVERPLTESEKNLLAALVPKPHGPFKGLELKIVAHSLGAAIFGVLIAIALFDLRWNFSPGAIVCLLAYFLYLWMQIRALLIRPQRLHRQKMTPYLRYQSALAQTQPVTVQRIRSNDVVQIDHDEGSFYLYSIDPNTAFWTSVEGPENLWPNTDFDVFRIPGLDEEIGPICRGERVKPRSIVEFSAYFEHFDFEKLPADGVINSSIDSFLKNVAASATTTSKIEKAKSVHS